MINSIKNKIGWYNPFKFGKQENQIFIQNFYQLLWVFGVIWDPYGGLQTYPKHMALSNTNIFL